VNGKVSVLCYGYSIANYESLESIVGTAFWSASEVLQALQDVGRLVCSKKSDVSNLQMLYYYEILTGDIRLEDYSKMDYDLILSAPRRQLTSSSVHPNYKSLLH
jgi:hypothetical protein